MLGKKVFNAIELLAFIVSCIASLILSQNVWEKYRSYESNFVRSVGPASESPTINICLLQVQANPLQYFQDFRTNSKKSTKNTLVKPYLRPKKGKKLRRTKLKGLSPKLPDKAFIVEADQFVQVFSL